MIELTQTSIDPGNCWQTAVACILEVDPKFMPPQEFIEAWPTEVLGGWGGYLNVLNGYLRTHHKLQYSTIYQNSFSALAPVFEYHVICGPTVRTPRTDSNHCVVGHLGTVVWDPHPSRLGLIHHTEWGVVGEYVERELTSMQKGSHPELRELVFGCLCPAHNFGKASSLALGQAGS